MPFANHTPYDYIPRRLPPQEIGNPFNVINKFFGWENFPEWRLHLDQWRDAALKPGYRLDNAQTLETFIRYEFLEVLLEGLFMISRMRNSCWLPDTALRHSYTMSGDVFLPAENQINKAIGYFNNSYAPKHFDVKDYELAYLNEEEQKHPMKVVFALWETYKFPQARDALYWWLVVSMDHTSADNSRGDDYLIKLHLHWQKVIEAVHLIYIWNQEKWPRLYP